MIYIIVILRLYSETLCTVTGGGVILEETTAIRIEMLHHRIKVLSQKNSALICSDALV